MSAQHVNAPMLEMFIFESTQMVEQLETIIMECEKSNEYTESAIAEIFRCMHTIKGSSAMMLFNDIASLSHTMEDAFYFLREQKPKNLDCAMLSDLILEGLDFIKEELEKIKNGELADGDANVLIEKNKEFLAFLKADVPTGTVIEKPESRKKKQYYIAPAESTQKPTSKSNQYKATIFFEDGCEMENIRAFSIVHNLKDLAEEVYYIPEDIIENEQSAGFIKENGFVIYSKTDQSLENMQKFFQETLFLKDLELLELDDEEEFAQFREPLGKSENADALQSIETPDSAQQSLSTQQDQVSQQGMQVKGQQQVSKGQGIISVSVDKLDELMDIVGEIVIAEAMVTQNPEIKELNLDSFHTAARQLHKITIELQDMVMSIRMVPLSTTFIKMHRILRDMSKKLAKEVELKVLGEETEVDKNIIERIGDPLMHLIRNAIDHGLEPNDERVEIGKPRVGTITIEAKNSGSDVLIIIRDDGRGLNKQKIHAKALKNGLIEKGIDEMSDKEVFNLILKAGFSMKEQVTEFSGRGVGMDVVMKNLEEVGGAVVIDSVEHKGTTVTMKIPLTLAIIDGMNCRVGKASYTIPIMNIKESFRPKSSEYIRDPDGQEIIMVRGQCYRIVRIHECFKVKTKIKDLVEGILVMVEQDEKTICLFLDELLGQQQVVVKSLPNYIKKTNIPGIAGCTLLGDGSISLILDIGGLAKRSRKKGHTA